MRYYIVSLDDGSVNMTDDERTAAGVASDRVTVIDTLLNVTLTEEGKPGGKIWAAS